MQYGVIGLVIAAALIAGLQVRPQNVLPSQGMLQISIQGDPNAVSCHGHNVTLKSLEVNITSVSVHRSGALNLTGDWITLSNTPKTIDLFQLTSVTQLGSTSVEEGSINLVRIDVSSATASLADGPVKLIVSSGHLQVDPSAQVSGGMTTRIVVMPHVVCEGNGMFRLTPDLTATSTTTDD